MITIFSVFYPYDYRCSFEMFNETLPKKNEFYNQLSGEVISCKEDQHFLKVWDKFEMKTMKDTWFVLKMKMECFIVSWCIWKFRNRCLESYGLCHSHYLSPPPLSWDAMIGMNKVELDLISDVDLYFCFERGMIGGVSYITKRYSKANKYWTYPKKL